MSRALAEYVMDQLSGLSGVRSRAMMGGYLFYYKERIFGGIYAPGFLVKDTSASRTAMPDSEPVPPYEDGSGTPMLPVTILDDREALCAMVEAMAQELPERKPRKRKAVEPVP